MHVSVKVEAAQMKRIQQENAQLLKMISKIEREGGRVITRWDKLFVADWYELCIYLLVFLSQFVHFISFVVYSAAVLQVNFLHASVHV